MKNNQREYPIVVKRNRLNVLVLLISVNLISIGGTVFLEYVLGEQGLFTGLKDIYRFFALFLLVLVIALISPFTWHLVTQHLLAADAVLVINHQGIQVGQLPWEPGSVFISWEELGAMYVCRSLASTFLCIRPKTSQPNVSRFGLWKLALKPIRWRTEAPLNINRDYIKQPIEEIFKQIDFLYAHELHEYSIQLGLQQ